jgi:hypothetical protein
MSKKLKISTLALLYLGLTGLNAQKAIPTSGGDAFGNGGSVSYSIGLVVFSTHTGAPGSVAEGVQQPYEISTVTGIDDVTGINLCVKAYPNPATDYLILIVDELDLSGLAYQLFDISGRLLQNEKIMDRETKIDMSNLSAATYFMKILISKNEIKNIKIIKN